MFVYQVLVPAGYGADVRSQPLPAVLSAPQPSPVKEPLSVQIPSGLTSQNVSEPNSPQKLVPVAPRADKQLPIRMCKLLLILWSLLSFTICEKKFS